jgi:hypothetical protein
MCMHTFLTCLLVSHELKVMKAVCAICVDYMGLAGNRATLTTKKDNLKVLSQTALIVACFGTIIML